MSKKILLLQTRYEPYLRDDEFQKIAYYAGLEPDDFEVHDLITEAKSGTDFVKFDPENYAGVIIPGSPFCVSFDHEGEYPERSAIQPFLIDVLRATVDSDLPFLGICYGMSLLSYVIGQNESGAVRVGDSGVGGAAVSSVGGTVGGGAAVSSVGGTFSGTTTCASTDLVTLGNKYEEILTEKYIEICESGATDPIFAGNSSPIIAYSAHNESTDFISQSLVDSGAVSILATSPECKYQAIRYKQNNYGMQFHPEMDADTLTLRVRAYSGHGYFTDEEADAVLSNSANIDLTEMKKILGNFARIAK
jgi:GMP synthase (glutamine-hydrolysing)